MDNMKDKFAQFSGISIMLVSASMTLFTRLVDGYYELKNVLSIIITLYICINLVIVSIPRWRSHPIHENRATESIWTEPCNPLLRATKSTKRATSA